MLPPPSSLRSQPVNGEFHGCGTAERGREHAGAICSQDLGLSSCPDLGKANNLQEQMSHPPFPPGAVGVSPPGLGTPTSPRHLGVAPCTDLGAQPGSKGTLQRPGNLAAGMTPPKCEAFGNLGMAQRHRGSLLPPDAPGTPAGCHFPGCHPPVPVGKDLEIRLVPTELIPCNPPALPAAHKGAWLCHHPHVARHDTGAKVQARLLRQQIPAGSRLVSRRSPGVASTGVFRTD